MVFFPSSYRSKTLKTMSWRHNTCGSENVRFFPSTGLVANESKRSHLSGLFFGNGWLEDGFEVNLHASIWRLDDICLKFWLNDLLYSLSLLFSFFIKILSNISNILLLIIYLWRIVAWESAAICFYNITNMRLLDQKAKKWWYTIIFNEAVKSYLEKMRAQHQKNDAVASFFAMRL